MKGQINASYVNALLATFLVMLWVSIGIGLYLGITYNSESTPSILCDPNYPYDEWDPCYNG